MFEAGRASLTPRYRLWRGTAALMTALSLGLSLTLLVQPLVKMPAQRIVYITAPQPRALPEIEPPMPASTEPDFSREAAMPSPFSYGKLIQESATRGSTVAFDLEQYAQPAPEARPRGSHVLSVGEWQGHPALTSAFLSEGGF
jgi:hypothetical protein